MNLALAIIFACLLLALALGILARRGKDMNLEQWTVGGRGFGTVFVFLLMAGEFYTTFSLLGGSGWAYGKGGPAFYILGYLSLEYVLAFFLLPAIWKYAKDKKLMSQSDFYASKYKSPGLGILVALIGVISMVPYLVVQFKGLGIIVSEASYGTISPTVAVLLGAVAICIYVVISGIHGSAWISVIKDLLIFGVVVFLGVYLPIHYYGGLQPTFEAVDSAMPNFLTLPDKGYSSAWFISTVLMNVIGAFSYPHVYGAIYSAKSGRVLRRNAIITPLYTLMLLFVLFVGFTAVLQVPGLTGADADLALLRLSIQTFDPWFIGIIGAAGLLTALVPGAMLLMTSATLLAKNVYHVMAPAASDKQITVLAKVLVPVMTLISVYFTVGGGDAMVPLILMSFSLACQLAPSMYASFLRKNFVTTQGAMAGIITGVAIVVIITLTQATIGSLFPALPQVGKDINTGILALVVNVIVTVVVSFATKNAGVHKKQAPAA